MNTFAQPESQQRPVSGDLNETQKDFVQPGRAFRARWSMPSYVLQDVVASLHRIVTTKMTTVITKDCIFDSYHEAAKTAVAAARVLVSIEAQNQADEHLQIKLKAISGSAGSVNVNNTAIAIHDARQIHSSDPEYIEFLRERAAREAGYSSHAGPERQPRTLETGSTATRDRSATGGLVEWDQQLTNPDAPLTTLGDSILLPGMVCREVPRRPFCLHDV